MAPPQRTGRVRPGPAKPAGKSKTTSPWDKNNSRVAPAGARGHVHDLLQELLTYAMDALPYGHIAASEQALQADAQGMAITRGDGVQGAPHEYSRLIGFGTVAMASARQVLG